MLHPPSSILPSSIIHPPSSILHHPSSIIHPPSSILHHPPPTRAAIARNCVVAECGSAAWSDVAIEQPVLKYLISITETYRHRAHHRGYHVNGLQTRRWRINR
jgi:hypothetical protein